MLLAEQPELDEILRVLAQMLLGQNVAQPQPEQCGSEYAHENDGSGWQRSHESIGEAWANARSTHA